MKLDPHAYPNKIVTEGIYILHKSLQSSTIGPCGGTIRTMEKENRRNHNFRAEITRSCRKNETIPRMPTASKSRVQHGIILTVISSKIMLQPTP